MHDVDSSRSQIHLEFVSRSETYLEHVSRSETHLELILLDDALRQVLLQFMQDSQHSDVGFSSSSGCADQQVLIGIVCRIKHHRLDTVQLFCAFESKPGNL